MRPTSLLMVVLGVFVIGRLLNKDSKGETLAGRLIGGQPSKSSTSNQLAPYTPAGAGSTAARIYTTTGRGQVMASQARGLAAQTHSPAFARGVLTSLGAPQTPANVSSLTAWINREGNDPSIDRYNPLDTTLPAPGAVSTNSVGVKSYPNWAAGVTATARTLAGGYSAIVAALKSGKGINPTNPAVSSELRTWSGGGYGSF